MINSATSVALARTATTNIHRLALVTLFAAAVLLMRALGAPVPNEVFAAFVAYITVVALHQKVLGRTLTVRWLDRLHLVGFLFDITFLTVIYIAFGGMWWMGSVIHSVVATAAFVALPRRRAWIVAVYAAIAFIGGILAQAMGVGPSWSILGAQSIDGNYMLAFSAALLGTTALLSGVYIEFRFIDIIKRAERHYQLIVKTAPEWIITTDVGGKITSANEATHILTGRAEGEVVGLGFVDLLDDEDRAASTAEIQATLADGMRRDFDVRYRSSDGEIHWLRCGCNRFSGEAAVNEVLIIARDITQRVRDREEIQTREALLAATEKLAHLGSWERDIKTDVVHWSDELYRMFGVEPGRPLNIGDFLSRVHPDDVDNVRSTIQRSVQTGESYAHDYRISDGSGGTRVLHGIGRVILDNAGCATRMMGSVQDITEWNTLTGQLRQAQKMEALGRLAGGIAHDFNNILTVITTYSEFLLKSFTDGASDRASDRADVEEIKRAAEKAASLTRQLLVFSRRQEAELQTVDLNASVESLKLMVNRLVGDNIEIRTRLEKDIWYVRADPGQIEQVLMNLVVNACDAMPGGGMLRIETANAVLGPDVATSWGQPEGRYAMLSVSDTGHGMTRETQARIFEPFFTTKEQGKGTGLGLSIVYGIVRESGGHIEAESELGRGTTFKVYLPEVESELEQDPAAVPLPGARGGSETILLVEDQDAVRTVVSRMLSGVGYHVIEAFNGVEAISIFDATPERMDIILTDMSMPGMSGKELATQVRRRNAAIPILFMSGYSEDEVDVTGEGSAGAIIRKPFTNDALLLRIRGLLDAGQSAGTPSIFTPA
ncbi:MAG: PAS domain-containing protein [Gemmatimonadaceae bacterium]|nr:PAS domain-containing protein [Gemmatimonadaceae bacterium]